MGKEKFVQIREIRGPKSAEWAAAKMWVITTDSAAKTFNAKSP